MNSILILFAIFRFLYLVALKNRYIKSLRDKKEAISINKRAVL